MVKTPNSRSTSRSTSRCPGAPRKPAARARLEPAVVAAVDALVSQVEADAEPAATQCAHPECDALVSHSQYCCRSCMYSDM